VIATLYFARVVVVPFVLALLFAFLLTTPVAWLQRLRVPRIPAALLVLTLAVAGVGAVGWGVTKQLFNVSTQLPSYKTNLMKKIDSLHSSGSESLQKTSETVKELGKELVGTPISGEQPVKKLGSAGNSGQARPIPVEVVEQPSNPVDAIPNLLGPLGTLGIVIVFTFFMMIQMEDLRDRFIRLAGEGNLTAATEALDEASNRVSRYLQLQLLVNVSYGIVVATGLHFIGIPNALLWGAIAATLRFLPYLGAPIAATLPILLSLALFDGWARPLMTVGLFVVLEIIVANLVEPMLYGAHTGLSSMAVLFAAVFWTTLWGPIGLILSTPLTVCLVVIGRHAPHLGFLQTLLGDEPVLTPETRFYQRLLAMDPDEARLVPEKDFKDARLESLCDSLFIPTLRVAKKDRRRELLDEVSEKFVFETMKEIADEQFERCARARSQLAAAATADTLAVSEFTVDPSAQSFLCKVVCAPAEDQADEIAGMMLAQLLQEAGCQAQCIPISNPSGMIAQISQQIPDMVCISALPPFAIAPARAFYRKLRAEMPRLKIVVGLWGFAGDAAAAASRIGADDAGAVVTTLTQAVERITALARTGAENTRVGQEILNP
jgi:predicted PurR-regulated permease PerM/methanogenic corrinoid protein MtbC1